MAIKVGINGFGRIGRNILRTALGDKEFDFVAVNDITDTKTLAHLLKYDSVLGNLEQEITATDNSITVDGDEVRVFSERDPALIDWESVGAEIVIESTGRFTNAEDARKHLRGTVKKVIISAPAKNEDITIVLGVNGDKYDAAAHHIISNASCTTNCLAPVAKVLNDRFGIRRGLMTTIHSYTMDQNLQDNVHKDLRRARAAAINMVPTTTGAAKAVALVIPELKGKFDGFAIRVPTPTVSIVDFSVQLERTASVEAINNAFREASESEDLQGILGVSEEELVSSDFIATTYSSVVDLPLTMGMGDDFFKVVAWYDNEWGYSVRVADLTAFIADGFEE